MSRVVEDRKSEGGAEERLGEGLNTQSTALWDRGLEKEK